MYSYIQLGMHGGEQIIQLSIATGMPRLDQLSLYHHDTCSAGDVVLRGPKFRACFYQFSHIISVLE